MKKYWIGFPGDFEIHQGMLQNFTREERGMRWPAYWYIDDCYKNVKFERTYDLKRSTTFTVHTYQQGYITIDDVKYRVNELISLEPGKHEIVVYVFSATELPTIYIEGDEIFSDSSWIADNYVVKRPVGYSTLFAKLQSNPEKIPYVSTKISPVKMEVKEGGLLVDFGKEINAKVNVKGLKDVITICYGESITEATDTKNCYYQQSGITDQTPIPKRAFRYLFIPGFTDDSIEITADEIFLPMKNKSSFKSSDETINQIWNVSIRTFKLCSDLFYIDGIKRDRWIWGGDAYQDNFINQYSFFNEDIDKRTIIALRGHDGVKQHINTIVDYSMLWVISIYNHYEMTGDTEFLQMIMPRMELMMKQLIDQTNDLGFIYGRKGDWIFVDWSPMDKEGTVAAEQIFMLQALKSLIMSKQRIHQDVSGYEKLYKKLKQNTIKYFWDEEKGAFIDSYESGKRNITRHANILAVLFDLVGNDKQQKILHNVLLNEEITPLTTPYFKFFEQDALCKLGYRKQVFSTIKDYWGSMIEKGATTVWEEYDPSVTGADQYAMYGDPFGKSLCHAWGASPVYLLGRYFIGVRPTAPGYQSFVVEPHLSQFKDLECTVPVKNGQVEVKLHNGELKVRTDRKGGNLIVNNNDFQLEPGKTVTVER